MVTVDLATGVVSLLTESDLVCVVVAGLPPLDTGVLLRLPTVHKISCTCICLIHSCAYLHAQISVVVKIMHSTV